MSKKPKLDPADYRRPDEDGGPSLADFHRPGPEELKTMAALTGLASSTPTSDRSVTAISLAAAALPSANDDGQPIYVDTAEDLKRLQVGAVAHIALHLFGDNRDNARYWYRTSEVDDTAASLEQNTQLAIATGWVEDGKVILKDGQKRMRGGRAIGMPHLKVEIVAKPERREAYLSSREMNTQRSDQTCLDDAMRWSQLLEDKVFVDLADLALAMKMSKPNVSKVLAIKAIPERLLQRMKEYKVTSSLRVAYEISRLFVTEDQPADPNRAIDPEKAEIWASEVIDEVIKRELSGEATRALIQAKISGPKKRNRADIREISFQTWKAQLKVAAKDGTVDLSFRGLKLDEIDDLTKALETAVAAR